MSQFARRPQVKFDESSMWMSTCPEDKDETIGEFLPEGEVEYDINNPTAVSIYFSFNFTSLPQPGIEPRSVA